jgi:hypothetical protein
LPHCIEFKRLIVVSQGDATAPVRLDALLHSGVIEVAQSAEHLQKRSASSSDKAGFERAAPKHR